MRTSYILKGATLLLSTLCACTSEFESSLLVESGEINKITVTMPDSPLDARTLISVGNTVTYAWASGDTIGIFPDKGYQVAFDMSSAEGDTYATFTGGGWALKGSSKYAAYYPFEYNNRQSSRIPITYEGQKQKGNKNADKAGKFNYMVAKANTPDNGSVNFEMQRLGRFIILKFNVPEPTILETVRLVASEEVFTVNGYVDLWVETPKIVSTEKSKSLSIKLEGLMTTEPDEEVTVYFFMAPVDLSGEKLVIEVMDRDGNKTISTVDGKDMRDNKAFALTGTTADSENGLYSDGVVYVNEAGTMKSLLGSDYLNISKLKIIGSINGDDIYYLRKMLGGSDFSTANWGKLTTLDLSEATIVEGGGWYYDPSSSSGDECYTSNNVIGTYMFHECNNLKEISLPKNSVSISTDAFTKNNSLETVTIHKGVIGSNSFTELSALRTVIIGNNVTEIGDNAFNNCDALNELTLGSGITNIGSDAFADCDAIKNITVPNGVIGRAAFAGCSALQVVTIGDNVTEIGRSAFEGCIALTTVTIPSAKIGEHAFVSCITLKYITLGISVTTIENYAFTNDNSIMEIICYATTPPSIIRSVETGSFPRGLEEKVKLYVPARCGATYKSSSWGLYFNDIIEMD